MQKDHVRKRNAAKERTRSEKQLHLPTLSVMTNTTEGLREFVIEQGLKALWEQLEAERYQVCGPRKKKNAQREAYRYGYDQGQLVLGGRKISVPKPRIRSVEGKELVVPSWAAFSANDPLDERVMEQILSGVSTRKYERSLEPVGIEQRAIGVKKSSVSRRLVAETERRVSLFLSRSLDEMDLPVVMIDGTNVGGYLLLVAMGIDANGTKQILGIYEGVSESEAVCRGLLRDLIGRGLTVERARLFVVDGSKGLSKAIRETFGGWALIQRCQVHKLRNVLDHLPKTKREWVRAKMVKAWGLTTAKDARAELLRLARSLEREHPSAAASIREGLDETLTLHELFIHETLYRVLRSTNPIENLQGSIKAVGRHVKRWRSPAMAIRWAVTALLEAEQRFRRIRGYQHMPLFLDRLQREVNPPESAENRRTA